MQRATLDLWVGIFVVVGILAILFLALKVGNMGAFDSAQTYVVKASFDNIGGLKVLAPVKSAGVVVGRVSDVSFDSAAYEAIVSLNLDARYKFPKDTSAAIMTAGLLGEQYIALGAVVLENLIGQFLYNKADGGGGGNETPVAE